MIIPVNNAQYLIEAGLKYPGAKVCESKAHRLLMQLAQEHAEYMAEAHQQGHQNFQSRWNEIDKKLDMSASEIAAETWDRQSDSPMEEVATEMFKSWEQSRGHWNVASQTHKLFGAGLAKGTNGIYYGCIITAD